MSCYEGPINMASLILGIIIGLILAIILIFLLKDRIFGSRADTSLIVEQALNKLFPEVLKNANAQLITMADQKLGATRELIETDTENKKSKIEELIETLKKELKESDQKLEKAEKERVGSYSSLKTELVNQQVIYEKLSTTTDNLRKVLSNNQLRGQFGEQVAEDLLRMVGFVNGVDYLYNKAQETAGSRPDFTILLPDGVKINVDVKFPYASLQRMFETEDKETQKSHRKSFENDIKAKIKQVTTREYINPEDNTVDFVILFIPNEMIFSFIYESMPEVWEEAMRQKVVFAGPFNFTATLRLIRQSYANFKIQSNVRHIVTLISTFEDEFRKYSEEFTKIGDRITSLSQQYERVNATRTNALVKTVEKIKLEEPATLPVLPETTGLEQHNSI